MKIHTVAFRDRVSLFASKPHDTVSRVSADAATALDYDAGLVTVTTSEGVRLVPIGNVLWMAPVVAVPMNSTKSAKAA